MTLTESLQVLRRRWVVAVLTFVVVVGASFATLSMQTPKYEATATVGLAPNSSVSRSINAIDLLGQSAAILPLYSEAVTTADTQRIAQSHMPLGETLAPVSVSTFQDFPTILRISCEATSPRVAQQSAQAYVTALQQRADAGEVGVQGLITLDELGSPQLPTAPVSPRKSLTLGVGFVIAVIAAIAAAVLREKIGGKIEEAEALGQAAGAPVFGQVPEARRISGITSIDMLLNDDRLRFVNEAMRDLGLALQLTQFEADSVLVTSPEGHHGKTTVAFGVAVSLARSGVETLLVDGDLRRGRIETMFSTDTTKIRKDPGLVDVLRGMPLGAAIQSTSLPNLSVLSSGALLDDPSDLLDHTFPAALREMERRYAVVIDGTPLIPINDARVIAKFCSSTVVVASAGTVTRGQIKRAVERLRIIGVTPTAVVMNRTRQRHSATYGQYLTGRSQREAGKSAVS